MRKGSHVYRCLVVGATFTTTSLVAVSALADTVTDWNQRTIKATKGFNGSAGAGVTLDSNLGSRVEAIEARAVFDAVNSIDHFSPQGYYYQGVNVGSAVAAVAQAAHDVILALVPRDIPIYGYIYRVDTGSLVEVPRALAIGRVGGRV